MVLIAKQQYILLWGNCFKISFIQSLIIISKGIHELWHNSCDLMKRLKLNKTYRCFTSGLTEGLILLLLCLQSRPNTSERKALEACTGRQKRHGKEREMPKEGCCTFIIIILKTPMETESLSLSLWNSSIKVTYKSNKHIEVFSCNISK